MYMYKKFHDIIILNTQKFINDFEFIVYFQEADLLDIFYVK